MATVPISRSQCALAFGDRDGRWSLSARAEDAAGNAAEATREVSVDTRPPVVAVTDPAPGTVVPEATLTISGTARPDLLDLVLGVVPVPVLARPIQLVVAVARLDHRHVEAAQMPGDAREAFQPY